MRWDDPPEPPALGKRRPEMLRGRPQLRTQVLAGVLLVTLVALVAFDVAAVSALRRYLLGRTDSHLERVLRLYQPAVIPLPPPPGQWTSVPHRVYFQPGDKPASRPVAIRGKVVGPRFKITPSILDQY